MCSGSSIVQVGEGMSGGFSTMLVYAWLIWWLVICMADVGGRVLGQCIWATCCFQVCLMGLGLSMVSGVGSEGLRMRVCMRVVV